MKLPYISYFSPLISRASVDLSSETHFLHLKMSLGAPTDMFADASAKQRTIWLQAYPEIGRIWKGYKDDFKG